MTTETVPIHDPSNNHTGDDMLTLQEACRVLRVPEGTLRYWRHLGCGPRSFKIGRHVRYWSGDILLWLSEQTDASQLDSYPQASTGPNADDPARGR